MPELTWKTVVRTTWFPNLIIIVLLAWIVATNHGWLVSQDTTTFSEVKANAKRLDRIEKQLQAAEAERVERHAIKP